MNISMTEYSFPLPCLKPEGCNSTAEQKCLKEKKENKWYKREAKG